MTAPALRASPTSESNLSFSVTVAQAAVLTGYTARHVRRLCECTWGPAGLASRESGEWLISEAAHPRLVDRGRLQSRDLQQLVDAQAAGTKPAHLELAKLRLEICNRWRLCDRRPAVQVAFGRFCAQLRADGLFPRKGLQDLAVSTIARWQKDYRDGGIGRLVPRFDNRGRREPVAIGEPPKRFFIDLATSGNGLSLRSCYRMTLGEATKHPDDPHWVWPSLGAVMSRVPQWLPAIQRRIANKGERTAKAACIPKMERDFEQIPAGDEWVGDERTQDVWCRVLTPRGWKPCRPKLTAWLDMRSRLLVGQVLRPFASSETILASLKLAIAAYGKPLVLRTDWGEDYRRAAKRPNYKTFDGQRVGSILDELGIEVRRVAPYTPYAKPIESYFRGMKERLDKLFAHFWGGCPSERHEDRVKYLKQNLEKLPTLEEVSKAVQSDIDCYHATPHSAVDMFGKSPLEAMAAFRDGPARMESEKVLDYLFRLFTDPKLVRRDGVRHNGRWYGNGDARLVAMQGRKVLLGIQPDDASRAMVCELDRAPMFEVECVSMRGLTQQQANEMVRERRRLLKPYREQARRGREFLLSKTPQELIALSRAGIEAMHGKPSVTSASPAVASVRVRPALEEAIDAAGIAPSDVPTKEIRTGTDDSEITLEDMLGIWGEVQCPPREADAEADRDPVSVYDLFLDECDV